MRRRLIDCATANFYPAVEIVLNPDFQSVILAARNAAKGIVSNPIDLQQIRNTMIKIDKGIPITSGKNGSKYPWKEMEIGDSFFTEVKSIHSNCTQAARITGRKFTVRREDKGFRVWRAA